MTTRVWHCGARVLDLSHTIVMGVLNVTPDSFSDGGLYREPATAAARADTMVAEGAAVIDVGGESTRPGAAAVTPAQELGRVRPVVTALAMAGMCVSVDTRHADTARACVEAGASIINDVSGFRDPAMVAFAAECRAGLVVMHMQGEPATMQVAPAYDDVVTEVRDDLARQARALQDAGVARDRIVLDPGIGFGKTLAHNLEILRRLDEIVALGYPVLVGLSRKRFIGELTGVDEPDRRLAGSIAATALAAERGAAIVRVHDVAPTVEALAIVEALAGTRGGGAPA